MTAISGWSVFSSSASAGSSEPWCATFIVGGQVDVGLAIRRDEDHCVLVRILARASGVLRPENADAERAGAKARARSNDPNRNPTRSRGTDCLIALGAGDRKAG